MSYRWDDAVSPANYLRVVQRFNVGNQVRAQGGRMVRDACMIRIDPSKGHLRRYHDDLDMGHDADFGAGEPR
eukprot:12926136-Ditylum_brightwellii.AAC.1